MKKSSKQARAVVVTRPTQFENLLGRHGTKGQAEFYLKTRGQSIEDVLHRHALHKTALERVNASIPTDWRRASVLRSDLDRFIFEPEDIVVVVGQDGLVANSSKYLGDLDVVGINPDPETIEGVLVPHPAQACRDLLADVATGRSSTQNRTMVEVRVDGSMILTALNELYIGQRTHQSARYTLSFGADRERQSSSGIIVSTGTGATGWARSISQERAECEGLPGPTDPSLAFFVREAWPSVHTGAEVTFGIIAGDAVLEVVSEMDDGVIFGDGIETDRIPFGWGRRGVIKRSDKELRLVV